MEVIEEIADVEQTSSRFDDIAALLEVVVLMSEKWRSIDDYINTKVTAFEGTLLMT